MRERFPHLVTLSLHVGRISLAVLRWSGLPETAHPSEATTRAQKLAFVLGACAGRMNDIGFGRSPQAHHIIRTV